VSLINNCEYCVEHHYEGMRKLLNDDQRAINIRESLEKEEPNKAFNGIELAVMQYVKKLTHAPDQIRIEDIDNLKDAGIEDGEILEVNQVAAYFAYANRTVLGLGVNKSGDIIGLSPNDEEDMNNWSHS
jgi:uncharacterized peroxidase-related enzyme